MKQRFISVPAAAAVMLLFSLQLSAQEERPLQRPEFRHVQKERLSPEKAARLQTDRMDTLLSLTDRQYRKLYRLNLKDQQERSDNLPGPPPGMSGGERPQGGPGGMRGGMPGGMGPGRMGGGPPPDFSGQDPRAGRPQSAYDIEKKIAAREKKLKKILSAEQYSKWINSQPDPVEVFNDFIR